jgi:hypothetical protein
VNAPVNPFARIQERLEPLRSALVHHPVYHEIDRLEALHLFMEHHVFAVWDFMSLLKTLQRRLSSVDVPWLPPADPLASRLVNEIVLAEESDDDGRGGFASHFELYRRAMVRCGASTAGIDGLVEQIRRGEAVSTALDSPAVPEGSRRFVRQTFEVIQRANLAAIASAFTFGREDLLPAVFQRIVDELNVEAEGALEQFIYYLKRHIGLDGDQHGPMASRLIVSLCGSEESRWQAAERAAVECLEARQALWNAILDAIRRQKQAHVCR